MSALLDSIARLDSKRSEDLDREDGRMFSDEQLQQADDSEGAGKAHRRHTVNDRCAMELQVQAFRNGGLL